MPCTSPITVDTTYGRHQVRCKQCLNCRILKNSSMRLRMLLEYSTATSAQFWTLTFSTPPEEPDYRPFSDFMKRLRVWNQTRSNFRSIRFFCVGERGEKHGRFHFHAMIYNSLDLPLGHQHFAQWPHGHVFIGQVTPKSIGYIGQYTMKFSTPDDKPMAHWSRRPVLGCAGMESICNYMVENNQIPDEFYCLTIEGRKYFLDTAMRDVASRIFGEAGKPLEQRSVIAQVLDHDIALKLGLNVDEDETVKRRDLHLRFTNERF